MSALGSLVVKLALDHAEYVQGLDRSEQAALSFAKNAQRNFDDAASSAQDFLVETGKNVVGFVAAFAGIDSVISRTNEAINVLGALNDTAQKTGSSVTTLSRIEQSVRAVGESFAPTEAAISRLARGMAGIDGPANQVFRALESINVKARDSNGELRQSADVFIDVAKSLQEYKDGAEKTALATELFGKSGADLIPVLNDIAASVDQFTGVSAQSAAQAEQFGENLGMVSAQVQALYTGFAAQLLPTLLNITTAVINSSNQFGSFNTVAQGVSGVLKGIAIAGFTVVDTLKRIGNEIGGRAAQFAAFASLDFEGAKFIGQSIAEDSKRAQEEYNKFVNTVLNGDKQLAAAAESGGMKKTLNFISGVPAAAVPAIRATKSIADASQVFVEKLQVEASQLGKTAAEIKKMEAAKLGVLDVAAPLIDRIEQETQAAKQLETQLSRVKSITESTMTAEERFARTVEELNALLNMPQGGLSLEAYNRALRKAQDELDRTKVVAKDSFDQMTQFAIQAERNIQNAFSDGFFRLFDGDLKGMVESFSNSIKQMVAQAAAADLLGNLFGKSQGFGNLNNLLGVVSGGSGGTSGGGLLAGLGSKLGSFLPRGSSSTMAFTGATFLGGPGTALGGTGLAGASGGLTGALSSAALPLAAAFAATQLFKSFAGDKQLGGGFGKALNTIGNLPIIGDFLPVVPLINSLFGRGPLKQKETNLIGNFTSNDFQGITSTKFKAQGGLLVSDKVERVKIDTDTGKTIDEFTGKLDKFAQEMSKASKEIGLFLDTSIKGISSSFREISNNLGLSTSAIDNFSASINIATEKGKGFTDEQLAEEIGKISDKMALELMPSLEGIGKAGESASDTLRRINNEFNALQSVGITLGATLQQTKAFLSDVSFEARTAFVDASGGIEALSAKTSFFIDNFLTAEEKLAPVVETVTKELNKLGVGFVDTNEEFKKLVQSQDLTTEAGRNMYIALLNIAPMFKQITDATGDLGLTVEKVTEQIQKATEEQIRVATRRAELAARERKEALQNEQLKATQEAQNALRESAIGLRDALLRAGDAAALLANEIAIKGGPRSDSFTDANGKFNAGAFNAALADSMARLSSDLIRDVSANALRTQNVDQLLAKLTRTITSSSVITPISNSIKDAIVTASGDTSNSIRDAVSGFARTLAVNQSLRRNFPTGDGIAGVLAAQRNFNNARFSGVANGREQRGADVVAYGQAIDELNERLDEGKITAEQHARAIGELNRFADDAVDLLNDTAAQLDRINKASLGLAKEGLSSIGFYFNDLKKQTKQLAEAAAEAGEPIAKATEAIGRLNSVSFVFGKSAKAVIDGFKGAGDKGIFGLNAARKENSTTSKAQLISQAASIASSVITTIDAANVAKKLSSSSAFADESNRSIRDISLLLDGIKAFDPESFEVAFLRINNALAQGTINQKQYNVLFNSALDTFEGLDGAAGGLKSAFGQLKEAASSLANDLLLDQKFTTLSPDARLKEAERQFNDVINRAKSGDGSATGLIDRAAKTLLETGQIALSNQTDLFTFVQARLREVGNDGQKQRLEVDENILKQLETMNKRLDDQQKVNTQLTAQVASINLRSTETLERWEKVGMPATRT